MGQFGGRRKSQGSSDLVQVVCWRGRVGGERHGQDRGEGNLWEPALCAQSEVSGQRRGVGANADHNICRLGRRKGLTFRKGKLLFLVISMPTTNRSGKP